MLQKFWLAYATKLSWPKFARINSCCFDYPEPSLGKAKQNKFIRNRKCVLKKSSIFILNNHCYFFIHLSDGRLVTHYARKKQLLTFHFVVVVHKLNFTTKYALIFVLFLLWKFALYVYLYIHKELFVYSRVVSSMDLYCLTCLTENKMFPILPKWVRMFRIIREEAINSGFSHVNFKEVPVDLNSLGLG